MRQILSFLIFTLLIQSVNAQLDPFFYGTYVDQSFSSSYTIYSMDEVAEDCFLVEYEQYEDFQTVFGASGFGHCDGENGHMEMRMETDEKALEIAFSMEENGSKIMTLYLENGSEVIFKEFMEEVSEIEVEVEYEEFYFSREDGAELLIFADSDGLGFTIFGLLDEKCELNEISGELTAANEDRSLFYYNDAKGCKIEFQFSDKIIRIMEEKCDKYRGETCKDWSGVYYLNE